MAKLFYVLGASGAGKDTVIDEARQQFADKLMVAHRYITRPAFAGGENYISLSLPEFEQRKQRNMFVMHWQANGLSYGVGWEVESWLQNGMNVMVNGSRAYLPKARRIFGDQLVVIWISVNPEALADRLRLRAREMEAEITARLERAVYYDAMRPADARVIDNSGCITATMAQLTRHIKAVLAETVSNKEYGHE